MGVKRPFDIGTVIRRVRRAVRPYPKAALFELTGKGYSEMGQKWTPSDFHAAARCRVHRWV